MAVAAVAVFLLSAATAAALPSDLDRSFGSHGKVLLGEPWLTNGDGSVASLVALRDGAVVGAVNRIGRFETASALFKLTPDGRLDTSFGTRGFASFSDLASPKVAVVSKIVVGPDGRLLVINGDPFPGGYPLPNAATFVLARYLATGALDESFGNRGVLRTDEVYSPVDVALAPDGGIVVIQNRCTSSECTQYLIRLNADGTGDRAFGSNGAVRLPFALHSLAVYPDGRIAAVGTVKDGFALIRFLPTGARDATFGTNGVAASQAPGVGVAEINRSLVIDRHGGLVVLGGKDLVPRLLRYRADGRRDRSFGIRGETRLARIAVFGVTAQRDGKFVVAGAANEGLIAYRYAAFALARVRADGRMDRTFGQRGIVITDLDPDPDPTATEGFRNDQNDHVLNSVAVGSRGVTVGGVVAFDFPTYTPVLLRYQGGSGGSSRPRYAIHVSHSKAGRVTGPFYRGDHMYVTLVDRLHRPARYEMCWTPHPAGHRTCTRDHVVGGPPVSGKLRRSGSTRLRFRIEGSGQVVIRRIRVHPAR